jgi:hypothetical protein
MRDGRGMQSKALSHTVESLGHGGYRVTSGDSGKVYEVRALETGGATCTCDWGKYKTFGGPSACSHVIAVTLEVAKRRGFRFVACDSLQQALDRSEQVSELGDGVWLAYEPA